MRFVPRTFLWIMAGLAAGAGGRWYYQPRARETSEKRTGARVIVPAVPAGRTGARESVEELLALPGLEGRDRLVMWLANATASEVAAFAKAWRTGGKRNNFLTETILYLRWAELDPEAMVTFERCIRFGHASQSFAAWAHVDPAAALTAALKEEEPEAATKVVASIGQSDPAKARALLGQYPQLLNRESLEGIAEGISRTDLRAGAEASMRGLGEEGAGIPVREWARAEPEQALAWARGISMPTRQLNACRHLIDEWEGSHPELIGPLIQSLPPSSWRESFYENHAAFLARTDPEAAVAWARTAEAPGLRESCLLEAAGVIASRDPAKAEEILRS
ncbi:MAG TPA: hypothetical protein VHM91_23155, partial [Verrucomicrobiales bacterium]|nr:hypothetical protein [Verrucomicrobiales bacterium]